MMLIVPIVEGHGEVDAVPVLLHRIAQQCPTPGSVRVNPPVRVKAGAFLNDSAYFAKYVQLAGAKAAQANGVVLILLDCEDDCPAQHGPKLLERALRVRCDVPTIVVLAFREFETWFVTAAESLRGSCGLPADLVSPAEPESIRGAKEWLSRRMTVPYDPIKHQRELARDFDIAAAQMNPSFRRFVQRVCSVFQGAGKTSQ